MSSLSLADQAKTMQQGLLSALSNDAAVTMFMGDPPRIHDAVPSDPVFPYMTFGEARSVDTSGDGAPLSNHQISLHIWSRYSGRAEVLDLMQRVENAVSSAPNFSVVPLYLDVFRTPDGRTRHGLLRLSITLSQPLPEEA